MNPDYQLPEPFLFNPLKHHLGFIREFINRKIEDESDTDFKNLIADMKHLGRSVMDVYNGFLSVKIICNEIERFLEQKNISDGESFSLWVGIKTDDFRTITLSDNSKWIMKYHNNANRYIHLFPVRSSPHTFRVKSNTLKSAMLYNIIIGKDFINRNDLNEGRSLLGLSPVKNAMDIEAILEMIEILRD
jgi:hypothetical protein